MAGIAFVRNRNIEHYHVLGRREASPQFPDDAERNEIVFQANRDRSWVAVIATVQKDSALALLLGAVKLTSRLVEWSKEDLGLVSLHGEGAYQVLTLD